MTPTVIYFNGLYEVTLDKILKYQSCIPDFIMFLQPYSSRYIAHLREHPPSSEHPVLFFASTTKDLENITYVGEVVGWDDKLSIDSKKQEVIRSVLKLQDENLYDASSVQDAKSVNLVYVRRLRKIDQPFSITNLTKKSDDKPLSIRTTSGGWAYVKKDNVSILIDPPITVTP